MKNADTSYNCEASRSARAKYRQKLNTEVDDGADIIAHRRAYQFATEHFTWLANVECEYIIDDPNEEEE